MKKVKFILLFIIIISTVATVTSFIYVRDYLNTKVAVDKFVVLEKGRGFNYFTELLEEENIIHNKLLFKLVFRLKSRNIIKIKYGEYLFEKNLSIRGVIDKIIGNKIYYRTITFAEGLSNHTILKMIGDNEFLTGEIPNNIPEGSLLPETYTFQRGDTRQSLIKRMQKAMYETIEKYWDTRDKDLPFKTKIEALILASIVEKETGVASERPLVASVFVNRLKINMPLQSDPTAIYGYAFGDISKEKEIKTSILIKENSPYNTYKIKALPPTPISNPGKESIKAVLNPAKTKYLFFVATGKGGHNFSENYDEHKKMIKTLQNNTKK
jgi:UPF0755 protein